MGISKFSPHERLERKREAARNRQRRCRARKRAIEIRPFNNDHHGRNSHRLICQNSDSVQSVSPIADLKGPKACRIANKVTSMRKMQHIFSQDSLESCLSDEKVESEHSEHSIKSLLVLQRIPSPSCFIGGEHLRKSNQNFTPSPSPFYHSPRCVTNFPCVSNSVENYSSSIDESQRIPTPISFQAWSPSPENVLLRFSPHRRMSSDWAVSSTNNRIVPNQNKSTPATSMEILPPKKKSQELKELTAIDAMLSLRDPDASSDFVSVVSGNNGSSNIDSHGQGNYGIQPNTYPPKWMLKNQHGRRFVTASHCPYLHFYA